jgi:integrase
MISLPNGCYCSGTPANHKRGLPEQLPVHPANWNTTKASLKKDWYIQYRFYDPTHQVNGKIKPLLRIVKGMNSFTTLEERQEATEILMRNELKLLQEEGYNPITNTFTAPIEIDYEIDPATPFIQALRAAHQKIPGARSTLNDIKHVITGIESSARQLRFSDIKISDIRRRHIKMILDQCVKSNPNFSDGRYNKYRSYLLMLFKELLEMEAIESNPISDISKKKTIKKMRKVLTPEERTKINRHLKAGYYTFWRFLHIFFHSGARVTELMGLQGKNVDLRNQRYKLLIKKGKQYREVWRTIKDVALPLWQEIMASCGVEDYLFSKGLKPGLVQISAWQISTRWRTHVKASPHKGGLGIEADFYSVKHLNTDETAALIGIDLAAAQNSHTSTVVTLEHYAFGEKERQHEKLKKVKNSFA